MLPFGCAAKRARKTGVHTSVKVLALSADARAEVIIGKVGDLSFGTVFARLLVCGLSLQVVVLAKRTDLATIVGSRIIDAKIREAPCRADLTPSGTSFFERYFSRGAVATGTCVLGALLVAPGSYTRPAKCAIIRPCAGFALVATITILVGLCAWGAVLLTALVGVTRTFHVSEPAKGAPLARLSIVRVGALRALFTVRLVLVGCLAKTARGATVFGGALEGRVLAHIALLTFTKWGEVGPCRTGLAFRALLIRDVAVRALLASVEIMRSFLGHDETDRAPCTRSFKRNLSLVAVDALGLG